MFSWIKNLKKGLTKSSTKINSGLKKQKITSAITNEEITVFPIQRENNSIYI